MEIISRNTTIADGKPKTSRLVYSRNFLSVSSDTFKNNAKQGVVYRAGRFFCQAAFADRRISPERKRAKSLRKQVTASYRFRDPVHLRVIAKAWSLT